MKNILTCLEDTCIRFPERIALADEAGEMSYQVLLDNVNHIGCSLLPLRQRNKPVAVYMERTPACIAAFLGVVCSGNFYVVLDSAMPSARIRKIFETLSPVALITEGSLKERTDEFAEDIPVFYYEDVLQTEINQEGLEKIRRRMVDTDPVYALYTSGSTGHPKGTIVSHKALLSYSEWFVRAFDITEDAVFGSQTPLYFSMSVSDLYGSLRTGARYQIIPKKYFSFPVQLMEYMNQYQINTIYWVPSALSIVANWDTFSYIKPEYLKRVLFAGEVMPNKQLNYWRRHFPDIFYANLFGPTETTDICCYYVVDRDFSDDESLPIGYACDNCGLLIVDEEGKESDQGELYVKGSFLAEGYFNDPEKTAAVFVQNPLNHSWPEIVYRTGDLVSRQENGELKYLGRRDFQIKHMGYRIELGEIEASVGALDKIKACVCVFDASRDKLILIYEGRVKKEALIDQIRKRLPAYMHPEEHIKVKQMPYNANGKIDRSYLSTHYQEL